MYANIQKHENNLSIPIDIRQNAVGDNIRSIQSK
jgi:hypothetical protein